jgi:hypothetical protein
MVEGGVRSKMSWVLDIGDGSAPRTGSTPLYESTAWFNGGTFSDFTQASSAISVQHRSFDLDVTLDYQTLGYPGGCSSSSGVCATISAPYVKVWAPTTLAPVPEPATWALWLAAACSAGWLRRRRAAPS